MRRSGCLAALASAALVLVSLAPATPAGAKTPSTNSLPKPKADIVVDAGNGRILVCDNIHTTIHPASTAKIMTALVAAERLAPDAQISANQQDHDVEPMKIGLPVGQAWPLDQMFAALMMVSANDAAYTIGHTVGGGSFDNWATIANATAKRLGLQDSTLNDPAGLDDNTSYAGGPMMSAYDLAVATRNALSVPAIAKYAAMHQYQFVDPGGIRHTLTNHNAMLPGAGYAYAGANGFKTGYTDRAQHSLVATATRNGRQLITVILGASDSGYAQAASLLDAGFAANETTPANGVAPCGGATIPDVKVAPYAGRAADRDAWAQLASAGSGVAATANGAAAVVPSSIPPLSQAPKAAPANTVVVAKHSSSSLFSARNFLVLLVLAGIVTFVLRRRAVRRQRAARLARRRQRMAAIRSGGLPVVDGRYRPGLRLGPPLESHVRVRPAHETRRTDIEAQLDALER